MEGGERRGKNKAKCLQLCPERTVEPTCRSPLPSGLCLAFGKEKKKNPSMQTSSFLKGKIYFINWPTPESNRLFFFFGGWWQGGEGAIPRGSAGRRAVFSHCCRSCTASVRVALSRRRTYEPHRRVRPARMDVVREHTQYAPAH